MNGGSRPKRIKCLNNNKYCVTPSMRKLCTVIIDL